MMKQTPKERLQTILSERKNPLLTDNKVTKDEQLIDPRYRNPEKVILPEITLGQALERASIPNPFDGSDLGHFKDMIDCYTGRK